MTKHTVRIGELMIGEKAPFFLIAGPCVIENEKITLEVAAYLKETSELLDIPVIFKSSY
ncbi:MAG: 3-deoxy-8-phosphooctulonate synthase, partial [Pseudomonadota bacterium]